MRVPKNLSQIKNDILGKKYELSVALVDEKTSKTLNKKYRNKNKPTNVLSFPLGKNSGEIILCPTVVTREAENFGRTPAQFLGFLLIHGMLHLKGFEHHSKIGIARMERVEEKYDQKYFSRHRRGLDDHSSGHRRIHQGRKNSTHNRRGRK